VARSVDLQGLDERRLPLLGQHIVASLRVKVRVELILVKLLVRGAAGALGRGVIVDLHEKSSRSLSLPPPTRPELRRLAGQTKRRGDKALGQAQEDF
jgi:hypothetical protein